MRRGESRKLYSSRRLRARWPRCSRRASRPGEGLGVGHREARTLPPFTSKCSEGGRSGGGFSRVCCCVDMLRVPCDILVGLGLTDYGLEESYLEFNGSAPTVAHCLAVAPEAAVRFSLHSVVNLRSVLTPPQIFLSEITQTLNFSVWLRTSSRRC